MSKKKKIIIYQIFTRLYGNRNTTRRTAGTLAENGCGKMNDFNSDVLQRIKAKGVTHVWYTGIVRHASQTDYTAYGIPRCHPAIVKGRAGSPYAIADYYDVDPDLAVDVENRMEEFHSLIHRTHKAGMKVITDFVPNHVARQYHSICRPEGIKDLGEDDNTNNGFDPQNNFYYCPGCHFSPYIDSYHGERTPYDEYPAKATGNDHFDPNPGMNDWYETVKLNYGVDYYAGGVGHFDPVPNTWHKMLEILLFWAEKGIDGFRCDMAEMVPAAFWAWVSRRVRDAYPNVVFIGEVYNPQEYRNYINAGFDYLYDKVGMYDTVRAVVRGEASATAITRAWQAVDDIHNNMLYFLENHDEQRIASDSFAGNGRRGIPALVVSALMQQNPFMFYAGQEFGERGMDAEGFSGCDGRTTIFDYWNIGTLTREAENQLTNEEQQLSDTYKKILNIASTDPIIGEGEFFDLMYANPFDFSFNPDKQFAFLRYHDNKLMLVVVNFAEMTTEVKVSIPSHAFDYLKLPETRMHAVDLLTGERRVFAMAKDCKITMDVPGWSARVWKMNVPL